MTKKIYLHCDVEIKKDESIKRPYYNKKCVKHMKKRQSTASDAFSNLYLDSIQKKDIEHGTDS